MKLVYKSYICSILAEISSLKAEKKERKKTQQLPFSAATTEDTRREKNRAISMFPLTRRQEKRTEQGTCWRLCSCWTPLCVPRVTTWPCLLHGKQPGALDKCVAGTLDYVSLCHRGRVRVCTLVCYGLQVEDNRSPVGPADLYCCAASHTCLVSH